MHQHFLPLCYLKNFTAPDKPPDHEPYVWYFQDLVWKKKSPAKLARITNFYGIKNEDGSVNQLFEEKLGFFEDKTAPILASLGERSLASITGGERVYLSYFLVSMQHRVPGFLNRWADEMERFTKWQYRMVFSSFKDDHEKFEKFKRSLQDEGENRFEEITMDRVHPDELDKWTIRPVTAFTLSELMKTWEYLAAMIYSMNWVLLSADEPCFVTSEAPVVSIAPRSDGGWINCPFGVETVDVSLPLTSRHALMCSWRGNTPYKVVNVNKMSRDVATLNLRTVNNAADEKTEAWAPIEVISATLEFPMSETINAVAEKRRSENNQDN